MTTILDRLRTHARANSGQFQVCLSIQEVREIVRDLETAERVRAALDGVMTGGNHLASSLTLRVGSDFSTKYPPTMPAREVMGSLVGTIDWDIWCCWAAIMNARAALAPLSSPAEVAAFIDSMDGGTKRIEG